MKNEQVDTYITDAAEFAMPILVKIRDLIHEAIPNIEEKIKWRMPSFEIDGKIVCSLAAYKRHCALRFWQGVHMKDPKDIFLEVGKTDMRHIGDIKSMDDLPDDAILKEYLIEAASLARP